MTSRVAAGGIILCGGASRRMGRPKYSLPFGEETLLQRTVRILSQVVSPLVVVAAADQKLPALPPSVQIARDIQPHLGPLAGLHIGLKALADSVGHVYATACDVPLLQPEFVRFVLAQHCNVDITIPKVDGFHHPLAAAYSIATAVPIGELLAQQQYRPIFLLDRMRHRELTAEELRTVDPDLVSLFNTNTPEDYHHALQQAGLPIPE